MYDFAIVGAGINGTFMAHFLSQAGKSVLLLDHNGIAGGGSGAAGAFLAPKVGKNGPLQHLINTAYNFSIAYYTEKFSHLLTQKGLLHLPKDATEAEGAFNHYKDDMTVLPSPAPGSSLEIVKDADLARKGLFYNSGAIIEPDTLCRELAQGADFMQVNVSQLEFQGGHWMINGEHKAMCIILASGAENFPHHSRYLTLRPVWGERIEVTSTKTVPCNYHQKISVSATKANGHIVIGATHEQNIRKKPLQQSSVERLLGQAEEMLQLTDVAVVDHRGGVRSGTVDYFPVAGPIVDGDRTLKAFPGLVHGAKIDKRDFVYYPNAYMINGAGGRGFVLAPYLAFHLSEHLLKNTELNPVILPSRLFVRWTKKEKSLKNKGDL